MARRIIVLAAKRSDAQAYARQNGLRPMAVLFATSRHTIEGVIPSKIVELPSFQNHRGRHGILEQVRRNKRKVHGGVEHVVLTDFDAGSTELAGQMSIDDFLTASYQEALEVDDGSAVLRTDVPIAEALLTDQGLADDLRADGDEDGALLMEERVTRSGEMGAAIQQLAHDFADISQPEPTKDENLLAAYDVAIQADEETRTPKPAAKKRAAPKKATPPVPKQPINLLESPPMPKQALPNLLDGPPVARDEKPASLGAKGVTDDAFQRMMDDLA